jgi:hypothetical protein
MGLVIVYVHGNGNKIRADLLKRQWDEALFGHDMGVRSRMAYWAGLRYPQPLPDSVFDEIEQPASSSLEGASAPAVESPEAFVATTILESQMDASRAAAFESASVSDEKVSADVLGAWLRSMTYAADALAEGEEATPPATSAVDATTPPFEVLPLPRPLRVAAFRQLVKLTFRDVYAYFFGGFREPIRNVVRSALRDVDSPVIVLGHSLGSIVAYDVLREENSVSLDVPLFVTAGSPLGVTEVQDLVERPLEVPSAVTSWRNVSDARDLVALDHTLRPAYAPPERCTDFFVINESGNHHGIREYLRTAPVRQPILELLQA